MAGEQAAAGSWWGLDTIFKASAEEFEAFVEQTSRMACPNDGEPLIQAPPTSAASGVELFCKFDGWSFPRDWTPPSRPSAGR